MKKLAMIALMIFSISIVVNAQKTDRVFVELTKTMLVVKPVETIKHQGMIVSYWKVPSGGFYYITEKQEFKGKYKNYNFTSTSNETIISGVDNGKKKKKAKKELLQDIICSQFY